MSSFTSSVSALTLDNFALVFSKISGIFDLGLKWTLFSSATVTVYDGMSTFLSPIIVKGLKRMEYRGYDSVGVATESDNKIEK